MDYNSLMMVSISGDELEQAKRNMIDSVAEWVMLRYPNIKMPVLERNLSTFTELKKYDDACKICLSVQTCPGQGCRMNGKMMADGVVAIWMEQCPSGYRAARERPAEREDRAKKWKRSGD